jgi:ATP-dependent Lhr-like helicase
VIVDTGHKRDLELLIELPDQDLGPIVRHEIWAEVFDKIVAQVKAHRTTLVFVNTRRLVERVAHQLSERLGEDKVGAHHGSLSRKTRLGVEEKLKSGALPVVVATASLELGSMSATSMWFARSARRVRSVYCSSEWGARAIGLEPRPKGSFIH